MNKLPPLLWSIVAAFGLSWLLIVIYAYFELGRLTVAVDQKSDNPVPPPFSGLAVGGEKVYAAQGCVACHSQQVRPFIDVDRHLGPRPTVARDYLRDQPALPGFFRIGPDLANVGLRSPDPNWFHAHLFEPATMSPGSLMPSYRFLYEMHQIQGQPSNRAVQGLSGPHAPPPGYEVLPSHDAEMLVAYLQSLKRNYPLPEAEPLKKP